MEAILTSMWGFLSIFMLCATIITTLIIVFKNKDGGEASISKEGFKVIKGKKKAEKLSPHSACPHARDIMDVVHRTLEHSEKRQELKASILDEQMRFYEETEEEIMGILKNNFIKILSRKVQDEAFMQNDEYNNYALMLKAVFIDLKEYVKVCFKTNHYSSMPPELQLAYIEKKKTLLGQKLTEAMNICWRGKIVTRSELFKLNKEFEKELGQYVDDIFNRAFLLSRETHERIVKLEKEYEEWISLVVGTKNE